jgi:transposase
MFACIVVFLHSATQFSSKEVVAHVKRIFDITISRQLAHLLIHRAGYSFKRTRKRGISKSSSTPVQPFADAFVAAYARL